MKSYILQETTRDGLRLSIPTCDKTVSTIVGLRNEDNARGGGVGDEKQRLVNNILVNNFLY